jgi:amino acid permease
MIFSFAFLLPLSITRKLSALRFGTCFGFFCAIFILLTSMGVWLMNRDLNDDLGESIVNTVTDFDFTGMGLINSFPIVLFAFNYQMNVPAIYSELRN